MLDFHYLEDYYRQLEKLYTFAEGQETPIELLPKASKVLQKQFLYILKLICKIRRRFLHKFLMEDMEKALEKIEERKKVVNGYIMSKEVEKVKVAESKAVAVVSQEVATTENVTEQKAQEEPQGEELTQGEQSPIVENDGAEVQSEGENEKEIAESSKTVEMVEVIVQDS